MVVDRLLGSAEARSNWDARIMRAGSAGVKQVRQGNSSRLNSLTHSDEGPYNEKVRSRAFRQFSSRAWGRYGFDGGKDSWDACRAPSSRKSGGTQRNCGHAARSRCLIK